jgi:hypothetical protein
MLASLSLGNVPTNYTVIGTGDFNGDGRGDILWRDSSGNLGIWLMSCSLSACSVLQAGAVGNVPSIWTVLGTGDFNGDGKADILWRDSNGNVAIWIMNSLQIEFSLSVGVVPLSFSVAGIGDFNRDGKADILWRDSSGNLVVWLMNGATVLSAVSFTGEVSAFSVAATGDYNGDGYSDILFRDSSGNTAMWLMNGTSIMQGFFIGNVATSWTVQSMNSE